MCGDWIFDVDDCCCFIIEGFFIFFGVGYVGNVVEFVKYLDIIYVLVVVFGLIVRSKMEVYYDVVLWDRF